MDQRPDVVTDNMLTCVVLHNMMRRHQNGADRPPTPADDIQSPHANGSNEKYRNPLREAKHQREPMVPRTFILMVLKILNQFPTLFKPNSNTVSIKSKHSFQRETKNTKEKKMNPSPPMSRPNTKPFYLEVYILFTFPSNRIIFQ